jgi:hypothetical protein
MNFHRIVAVLALAAPALAADNPLHIGFLQREAGKPPAPHGAAALAAKDDSPTPSPTPLP